LILIFDFDFDFDFENGCQSPDLRHADAPFTDGLKVQVPLVTVTDDLG
jgi:hypothetical protein